MPSKPTKKPDKTSLDRMSEKDLEIPEGFTENVVGGKSICGRVNPKLVPIPTKPIQR
jgi:hypothetical protein